MHISLRMFPEIDEQRVCVSHGVVEVVVEGSVAHEQPERAISLVEFVGERLEVVQCLAEFVERCLQVEF